MNYYFELQYKIFCRNSLEFGLYPLVAFVLIIGLFVGLSYALFLRTEFAAYIYSLVCLHFISRLSEKNRNEHLTQVFFETSYTKIRFLENSLLTLPFIFVLLYQTEYILSVFLLLATLLLAKFNFHTYSKIIVPTPFSKHPFEFIRGFRSSFYIFIFSYIITYIAIQTQNSHLGLFSLCLSFFVIFSFYTEAEAPLYVWNFALSPNAFLREKIKIAIWHSSILTLPILLSLSWSFPVQLYNILFCQIVGYFFLTTVLLGKYSLFPQKFGVPQAILLAIGISFPPFLLVLMVFFYHQSVQRLQPFLNP